MNKADNLCLNVNWNQVVSQNSLSTLVMTIENFNPSRVILRQARKKCGKELAMRQSSRRDDILCVFACANSINF
jgi:hypothetical protein